MAKGLLILLVVFAIIGIIHIVMLRLINAPEQKKQKIRNVFWYMYGLVFSISGFVNLLPFNTFNGGFDWLHVAQMGFGIGIIVFNFLGKIDVKS
ncbi:MAG: hypothetical protein ACPF80_00755 [Flavobacteriaceae bacterium]